MYHTCTHANGAHVASPLRIDACVVHTHTKEENLELRLYPPIAGKILYSLLEWQKIIFIQHWV